MNKTPLLLTTLVAVAIPASALAATIPATPASLKIEGAYAFHDRHVPLNKDLLTVVVKTHGALPRRYDGLIRAGGTLSTGRGGSVGSANGSKANCYTFAVQLKNGRFYADGDSTGAKATVGSRRLLTVSADDASGEEISSHTTITIRTKVAGSTTGKSLGC